MQGISCKGLGENGDLTNESSTRGQGLRGHPTVLHTPTESIISWCDSSQDRLGGCSDGGSGGGFGNKVQIILLNSGLTEPSRINCISRVVRDHSMTGPTDDLKVNHRPQMIVSRNLKRGPGLGSPNGHNT